MVVYLGVKGSQVHNLSGQPGGRGDSKRETRANASPASPRARHRSARAHAHRSRGLLIDVPGRTPLEIAHPRPDHEHHAKDEQ